MTEDLDLLDKKILSILQKDARRSYAKIARELKVNEATIRFRVKKLVEKQVIIQFSALLNPRKIGLSITGIIMTKITPKTSQDTFNKLKKLKELLHIFQCTGKYDFLAVANVKNMEGLEILKEKIREISGIEEIEVLATTRLIKIEPSFEL
ncbi:MAG: Lrp/AsnC family transcriptional regulator [Candidatus Thorarchaeota archaeon]